MCEEAGLRTIVSVLSLALIGNAPGRKRRAQARIGRGIFDKETRRKPLVFAADAVYGDSKAVWYRKARAGAPMNSAVSGSHSGFGVETAPMMRSGEGREVFGTVPEYTPTPACGKHVARRGWRYGLMRNRRRKDDAVLAG